MGLDMNLYRKVYVRNWQSDDSDDKITLTLKKGNKPIDLKEPAYVLDEVGYWRKANQIHNWFVKNVQGGEDDCKEYVVYRDNLNDLLDLVNLVLDNSKLVNGKLVSGQRMNDKGEWENIIQSGKVIADPAYAKKYLPTAEGFFFGSTGYDQWYIEDLKDTKKILEKALEFEGDTFIYSSSW